MKRSKEKKKLVKRLAKHLSNYGAFYYIMDNDEEGKRTMHILNRYMSIACNITHGACGSLTAWYTTADNINQSDPDKIVYFSLTIFQEHIHLDSRYDGGSIKYYNTSMDKEDDNDILGGIRVTLADKSGVYQVVYDMSEWEVILSFIRAQFGPFGGYYMEKISGSKSDGKEDNDENKEHSESNIS
jgi:hypothetical protein